MLELEDDLTKKNPKKSGWNKSKEQNKKSEEEYIPYPLRNQTNPNSKLKIEERLLMKNAEGKKSRIKSPFSRVLVLFTNKSMEFRRIKNTRNKRRDELKKGSQPNSRNQKNHMNE